MALVPGRQIVSRPVNQSAGSGFPTGRPDDLTTWIPAVRPGQEHAARTPCGRCRPTGRPGRRRPHPPPFVHGWAPDARIPVVVDAGCTAPWCFEMKFHTSAFGPRQQRVHLHQLEFGVPLGPPRRRPDQPSGRGGWPTPTPAGRAEPPPAAAARSCGSWQHCSGRVPYTGRRGPASYSATDRSGCTSSTAMPYRSRMRSRNASVFGELVAGVQVDDRSSRVDVGQHVQQAAAFGPRRRWPSAASAGTAARPTAAPLPAGRRPARRRLVPTRRWSARLASAPPIPTTLIGIVGIIPQSIIPERRKAHGRRPWPPISRYRRLVLGQVGGGGPLLVGVGNPRTGAGGSCRCK